MCLWFGLCPPALGQKTLRYGYQQRVRNENWNNLFDFSAAADDERVQVRYRTRLWVSVPLTERLDVHAGLNQETCQIITPDRPFQFHEVIFETAYVDFRRLLADGLSLRVGRQDISKGEGFLLFEGSPYDGSRTHYMNAAVLGYGGRRRRLELMAISNPQADRYLPRIHDRHRMLIDWDETAVGAYYTDNRSRRTPFDLYYFLKKEFNDRRPASHPQYQPDRHLHTAGGRVVHDLRPRWSLTGEWAFQWGADNIGRDIRAWGGYGYARRRFGREEQHYLQGGYWAMSGDDPATGGRVEGWDPLFGRWPKWSELYIYTQMSEKGAGYWTNLGMWQAEAGLAVSKRLRMRFTFYRMGAYQPFPGDAGLYGSGRLRGDQFQVRGDFRLRGGWSGHAVWEQMRPGNFYSRPDRAYFLRFEILYTFERSREL